MNSIAVALNNIALSITNLSNTILKTATKNFEQLSKSETSNGAGHVTITSVTTTESQLPKPFIEDKIQKPTASIPKTEKHFHLPNPWVPKVAVQKVVVFKDEKDAIDAIVKAVTEKGINPKLHDKMMKKLKDEWPVLARAIDQLVATNKKHYNPKSYENSKDIWKSDNTNWNK